MSKLDFICVKGGELLLERGTKSVSSIGMLQILQQIMLTGRTRGRDMILLIGAVAGDQRECRLLCNREGSRLERRRVTEDWASDGPIDKL